MAFLFPRCSPGSLTVCSLLIGADGSRRMSRVHEGRSRFSQRRSRVSETLNNLPNLKQLAGGLVRMRLQVSLSPRKVSQALTPLPEDSGIFHLKVKLGAHAYTLVSKETGKEERRRQGERGEGGRAIKMERKGRKSF
ncbi:uncharacterized protein LOC118152102 [Callithrix jacchus]